MTPALIRMLRDNPVVVTACGVVSAAGPTLNHLWQAATTATCPVVPTRFLIHRKSQVFPVCPILYDLPDPVRSPALRRADRAVRLAWAAATQAWKDARLGDVEPARIGIVVGSSRGPLHKIEDGFHRLEGPRYPPSLSAESTMGVLSGSLAQALPLSGPSVTISATCASGAYAIAFAAEQILLEKADAVLAGATEAPLIPATLAQFNAAGVLGHHPVDPARTCRPFDVSRNGLCLGEGSAFLVLESLRAAQRRHVRPLARLSGWGLGMDNGGRSGVSEDGRALLRAVGLALELAELTTDSVDYINAHGTGTRLNDRVEAHTIRHMFGERTASLPCTSTKPVTGHCLGATPALEAALCLQVLQNQTIPATANCHNLDPECPIHPLAGCLPIHTRVRHVLSQSLGFWGYHAALVFSQPD